MFCIIFGSALAAQPTPSLYLGEDADLSISTSSLVTVTGNFQSENGSQFHHAGVLTVSGEADLSGSISIILRGDIDFSFMDVGGKALLQDGELNVSLAGDYVPVETTVYEWLFSDVNVVGPFGVVNLPGDGWRTEFSTTSHSIVFDAVLPVEWLYFHGEAQEVRSELTWATASEVDASHFLIERLDEDGNWITVGREESRGQGGSGASYIHHDPRPANQNTLLYRLRQVDFDGTEELSSVVTVTFSDGTELTLWPNPTVRDLRVQGISDQGQATVSYRILDGLGRTFQQGEIDLATDQTGRLTLEGGLPPGTYYLMLDTGSATALPFMVR